MPTSLSIRRRQLNGKIGIGMPGDNNHILNLARRLREVVDAPVLGGIAVYLHGVARTTVDLDLYSQDPPATTAQLEAAGARWDKANREHVLDGVRIHIVTTDDAGITVDRTSVIDGVRVVTLTDLVAIKLLSGLKNPARSKDLGEVEDLIRAVSLDKRFAARLPKSLRSDFKALEDAVRKREKSMRDRRF